MSRVYIGGKRVGQFDSIQMGDGSITTSASNLTFLPAAGYYTQFGDAGSTSNGLNTNDDVFFSGRVEIDGKIYADGGLTSGGRLTMVDNIYLVFGNSSDTILTYSTAQTPDSFVTGLSDDSNGWIITNNGNVNFDYGHLQQANPTIFFQSKNQSLTEWGSLCFNETDFVIDQGAGTTKLAGGVKHNVTTVNAATYDLLISDYILHVTYTATGAVTSLTLPTAQTKVGRTIIIKDAGLNAGTFNITIDTEGGELIDGNATYVMSSNAESVSLYSDGTDWFSI